MTRSMVFTNTSNWDGEDYVLREWDGGTVGYDQKARALTEVTLKPGETTVVYPREGDAYSFEPVESKEITPFMMNGRQMVPCTQVAFE